MYASSKRRVGLLTQDNIIDLEASTKSTALCEPAQLNHFTVVLPETIPISATTGRVPFLAVEDIEDSEGSAVTCDCRCIDICLEGVLYSPLTLPNHAKCLATEGVATVFGPGVRQKRDK